MTIVNITKYFLTLFCILITVKVIGQSNNFSNKKGISAKNYSNCFRTPPFSFISIGGGFGTRTEGAIDDVSFRIENEFGSAIVKPQNQFYFMLGKRFLLRNRPRKIIELSVGSRIESFTSQHSKSNITAEISSKRYVTGILTANYAYYLRNPNFSSPLISGGVNLRFNNLFYRDGITLFETSQNGDYDFLSPAPVEATFTHRVIQKAPYFIIPQARLGVGYEYKLKYKKHLRVMLTTEVDFLESSSFAYKWGYSDINNSYSETTYIRGRVRRMFFSLSFSYLFGR